MENFKGLEFVTDKGSNCLIVSDISEDNYIIIDMDNFDILAKDSYNNILELMLKIKHEY